jgi:putative ABC transport system permease protein
MTDMKLIPDMLKNYFRIAWRDLLKSKVFSFINITGLALGITCSLLILLWVQDERSVDNSQANGNRLYILYERQYIDQKIDAGYYTPGLLSYELKNNIPEVENAVGYIHSNKTTFEAGNKILKQDGAWAGADYFKMFSYPLLEGSPATALSTPSSMAISNKMAFRFFGSAHAAYGKTIRYKNRKDFTITAVFADLPKNISQGFDFLLNWEALIADNEWLKDWRNNSPQTYIMLRADADPKLVEKKLTRFLDAYNKSQTPSFRIELAMQKFGDTYLHSNFVNGRFEGGRIEYVWLFSMVALFILFIACINFMNLTTARSARRSREIGIRKVSGAVRGVLIRQFLSEALFITILSVLLSLILVYSLVPFFNQLTGKHILFPFSSKGFWLFLACLTIVTGFVSGSYPALFLSSFNPVQVLKAPLKFKTDSILFRKGLVVFQFILSIILIVGTIYISKQVNYVQKINLGYDRENLMYVPLEGDLSNQYQIFKEEGMQESGIKSITRTSDEPTELSNGTGSVVWDGKDPNTTPQFTTLSAGYDFVKTMDLTILEGREFSREFISDSSGYLVNEEAMKIIGYKDPVGSRLSLWDQKGKIVGVLKDFHFTSLHDPIKPLIVHLGESDGGGVALVRIKPGMTKQAIIHLEKICRALNPQFPFSYSFSNEEYQKLYRSEEIVSRLSNYFAGLAIFISCIGLLGLAMFTAEQRKKEFGIRKVLGASVVSLFSLLSGEFVILVVIALFIACPVAWWAMNAWVSGFAYRVKIEWWLFFYAGIITIIIALITVSFQAFKAALTKPITSLRAE